MAKKLNRNLVGILTLVFMVALAVIGFAMLANLPGQDPTIYAKDAEKHEENKEYEMAAQTYFRAYQRDPSKNPDYLVHAARCQLELGKIPMARELLRNALVRNATLRTALEMITDLEFEIAQKIDSKLYWNNVLTESKKLAEVDPGSVLAQHAMGAAYLQLQAENDRYKALGEAALKKALELDPTNAKAADILARQWWADAERERAAGRIDQADEIVRARDGLVATTLEKCRAAAPDRVPQLLQLQAIFKIVSNKIDEGIADLNALVQNESGSVDAHRMLAQIYTGMLGNLVPQDLPRAESIFRKALQVDPGAGQVYLELGNVYKRMQEAESDPQKRAAIKQKEVELYKQGLASVPRTTHFRKMMNNLARVNFFTELFLADLAYAELADSDAKKNEAIAQAEGWVNQLKQEVDPGSLEVKFLVANLHAARDELVEATREAEAAERLAGTRGHIGVQVLLAELYSRQQQWGAAEGALKKAIALNPEAPPLILRLAQVYLRENKATEALALLKPTDLGPRGDYLRNNPIAARLRVEALRQLEQYDQALEESKRLGGTGTEDELRLAQILLLSEKYDEAEAKLKALQAREPDNVNVLRALAKLYRDTNRLADARSLVKSALSRMPDNRVLKMMDLDLMDEGDTSARKQRALEILNEEKDPVVRSISLFDYYFSSDDYEEAQKHIDAAEKLQPDNPAVVERQFRNAVLREDWPRAEKYAKRQGELNIDGTEGALSLGRLAMAQGKFDDAITQIRAGLQRYPTNAIAWTLLAEAYLRANRPAEAKNVLQEALKRDPTSGYANRAMAEMALREGNEKDAEKYLRIAARSLPTDPFVKRQLQTLQEKENPKEGIASREKLRQQDPNDLQNLILLARLYGMPEVGQFEKAIEVYKQAVAVSKNDLQVVYELAEFLGREDVNRPAEGDAILVDMMTKEEDKSRKALIASYLGRFYERQKVLATADRHYRLAVSLDPSVDILKTAGEYYARTNRLRDSLEYFSRALKLQEAANDHIGAEDSSSRLIALCLAIGDLDQARTELDKFLEKYPENPQGMIYEGAYHRIAGDVQQAKKSFDSHLEKNPDNAVALWQRGELFRLMGRWQKAIDDLTKSKTFSPNAFSFQHRISLADTLMEIGRNDSAVNELRSILDEHPEETTVAEALVDVYSRIGPSRYPDAEALIYTYMQRQPRDHRWPMLLGRLAEKAQNLERAVQAYQKAAELSRYSRDSVEALFRVCRIANQPKVIIDYAGEKLSGRLLSTMPSALANVAWAYMQTGDPIKATEFYDRALSASEQNFALYTGIILEIVQAFGKDKALAREQERAAAEPENVERQKVLVHLLQLNDKIPEALAVCEKIARLATRDQDTIFSLLGQGMLKQRLNEHETARQFYEEALKYDPDNPLALNNLAALLAEELDRPAEALPYAQRARRADPDNQDVLDTLGWTLTLNNRTGEALGVFLRSLALNREHVVTLYHLGMLHLRRKEYEEAERRLLEAKRAAEKNIATQGPHPYLSNIEKALEEARSAGK